MLIFQFLLLELVSFFKDLYVFERLIFDFLDL